MSEHLLELSDNALRLSNRSGLVASSPGFASVEGDAVYYGEPARARYRLYPRDSFNQFWHQLSLEPLRSPNRHFRHHADMAFGHLSGLTSEHAAQSNVVLTLPGHYSRDQMAIVLGLLQHCPVEPAGLVDQGVLAAASAQHASQAIYLDLQLHQAVLTTLHLDRDHVTRTRVQQIPGAGLVALYDAWASMITDAFVKQCRFNPQHTAETEQFLHDSLPRWMESAIADNEVRMSINHKGTLYEATALRTHFEQKSRNVFSRIARELGEGEGHQLLLPEHSAVLPGCHLWLPPHDTLNPEAVLEHAYAVMPFIRDQGGANILLTTLPAAGVEAPVVNTLPTNRHLLIGHRTWALPAGGQVSPGDSMAADAGLPFAFTLDCGDPLTLGTAPEGLLVNGEPAATGQAVHIGDRVGFRDSDIALQVIEVG